MMEWGDKIFLLRFFYTIFSPIIFRIRNSVDDWFSYRYTIRITHLARISSLYYREHFSRETIIHYVLRIRIGAIDNRTFHEQKKKMQCNGLRERDEEKRISWPPPSVSILPPNASVSIRSGEVLSSPFNSENAIVSANKLIYYVY